MFKSDVKHEKRPTVPNTLHGTINQVHKSMFHAFINSFETNKDFHIATEDTAFGDFDDVVIVSEEGKTTAIQYKHKLNQDVAEPITMNNLVTFGGSNEKLKLHSYYKSVVEKRVDLNKPDLSLIIAIDVPVSAEISSCLDDNEKCFNASFFSENISENSFRRRIIVASILKHNEMLSNKLELVSFVLTHIKYVLSCNLRVLPATMFAGVTNSF